MMQFARIITVLLGLMLAVTVRAEIVVVVNPGNPVQEFSHRELVDMFMGRTLHFPDGSLALRLDQSPKSQTREDFYRKLVNRSVAEINAYWAKLLFGGRATPPQNVDNAAGVLSTVQNNLNAIGYINREDLTDSVRVVGRID